MKLSPQNLKIDSLELSDLVNLIATGIVDSTRFEALYHKPTYNDLPDKDAEDCLEDKCAKVLLAGGTIKVIDFYADGVGYAGNDVPFLIKNDDTVEYTVDLKRIIDGLENAANGEFIPSSDHDADILQERKYVREAFDEFSLGEDAGGFDADYADALVQIILFGEIIYA